MSDIERVLIPELGGIFIRPLRRVEDEAAYTRFGMALTPDDLAARPARPRPPRRVRVYPRTLAEPDDVYPRYNPGPDAVRVCNATYVQEFRPSGTVIVPRMTCVWRRG